MYTSVHKTLGIDYWKGKTVQFGAWVKTDDPEWYLKINDGVGVSDLIYHPGDGEWHFLKVRLVIAPTATMVRVYVLNLDATSTSVAYIDSAILVEGPYCPPIDPPQLKTSLRDIGLYIGSELLTTSADTVITDPGFRPSGLIVIANDFATDSYNWSIGFSDFVNNVCMYSYNDGANMFNDANNCINITNDASNSMKALTDTVSAEGFTLTATRVGACAARLHYLALP
jgi:hypothetical protein